jgi:hypothetical protein
VGGAHDRLRVARLRRLDRHRVAGQRALGDGGLPTHALGRRRRSVARGLDDARDRRAGEQQHAGEQQEDEQDVRPGLGEQLRRGPEQRLADEAAVVAQVAGVEEAVARRVTRSEAERAGRQAERERREQAQGAGLEGMHRRQHRPEDDCRAGAEEGDRGQVARAAEQEEDAVGHPLPHFAAGPAEVEHAGEEGREGDHSEPDQVPVALLEVRKPERGPGPARSAALAATA